MNSRVPRDIETWRKLRVLLRKATPLSVASGAYFRRCVKDTRNGFARKITEAQYSSCFQTEKVVAYDPGSRTKLRPECSSVQHICGKSL